MATKTRDETSGCTFQWKIDNISHCWLKKGEMIDSPRFIADALEGTKWFLRLYPSGYANENYICFYLRREKDCVGPDFINVNYQIAVLDKDGSVLKERIELKCRYRKPGSYGFCEYEEREKVFVTQRDAFLPKDSLTVQCTIWNADEKPAKPKHLYARTVFKVNRRNFMWKIDKFSTLKSGLKNKFKDSLIEFDLVLNEGLDFEKKLVLNINSFEESIKYFSFKASTVDSKGKKEYCGTHEYFADDLKGEVLSTLLFTKKLMENKSRYLTNDVLSLYCEYVYSEGTILYEHCGYGVISPDTTNEVVESRNIHDIGNQEALNPAMLVNDLKFMYNDAIFSDMNIRTLTRTFPVHKAVLSARSPVFRSMFSNDMKEKNSGHVDITDFEDDTIHRMLLYMYTDSLEDLQFESASNLYVSADKYQIPSLKCRCCSFLKDNLSPTRACEVLILADQHQDIDLKCFVQDYILENYKDVFGSEEWKDFMDTHLKLAADVMYRFTQRKINDP
ncbi:Speckle-type POZ protein [Araneus ventricosus]|uniref:Speckle-type POZ protein n=1 Tax=Araneus ventricosus TaxID=182803 RepID=A0A4Y2JCS7_ARAVE|nr:Speckle-type POZ protein [Araneus ventricosus]